MDKKRYQWRPSAGEDEKYLIDTSQYNRVVAIVAKGCDELLPGVGGSDDEREPRFWWGVYSPFKKKALSQHVDEKDATLYAETYLAQGEKEERVAWES